MFMSVVAAMIASAQPSGSAPPTFVELVNRAGQAERDGRFADALAAMNQVSDRVPASVRILQRVALLAARAGQQDRARTALERIAASGGSADLSDPAFLALRQNPGFADLERRLQANAVTVGTAETAFSLVPTDLVVEGMANVPGSTDLLFASMYRPRIVRRSGDGQHHVAAFPETLGVTGLLGLKADPGRNRLWVCARRRIREVERASLLLLNLADLSVVRPIDFPDDGAAHLCNDVDILPDGRVVVTDSDSGRVWIADAEGSIAPLTREPSLAYPNGVAVGDGGRQLYVATAGGVMIVDVGSGAVTPLRLGANQSSASIDGLYRRGNRLIGIQNGFSPMRIVQIDLQDSGTAGDLRVIAAASPAFELPTTGALVDEALLLIANAQFRKLDQGQVRAGQQLDPTRILRVALPNP